MLYPKTTLFLISRCLQSIDLSDESRRVRDEKAKKGSIIEKYICLDNMEKELFTEADLQSSRKLIRAFEVANHFAGKAIDRSAKATIILDENGATLVSEDVLDGVRVCFPLGQINSSLLAGSFSLDTRFPAKVLKTGGKRGIECFVSSKDLFGDLPYFMIRAGNASNRITLRQGHEIFADERECFREVRLPNFEVTAGEFLSALETVKFAARIRNYGPSGIMVDFSPQVLKITAVDPFRLCRVVQERQKVGDTTGDFVITSQCAEKLAWLLRTEKAANLQNPLRIYRNTDNLKFSFLDYQVFAPVSDLLAVAVRNHEQYILSDDQISTRIIINTRDLQQAIAFVQPERVECVTFNVCGTQFTISSKSVLGLETGAYNSFAVKATVDAEVFGQEMAIKFDPELLLEFLERVSEGRLEIGFSGPEKPAYFRSISGRDLIYMLMPMKKVK